MFEVFAGRQCKQIFSLVPYSLFSEPLDTQEFWNMRKMLSASRSLTVSLAGKESWTEKGKASRGACLVVQRSVHSHLFKDVGPKTPHLLRKSTERLV